MNLPHSPALVSRSMLVAPVNAPKNSVCVSTAMGAERAIVGVPTLPRIASTALGPRSRRVVDAAGSVATGGIVVVGHRGASFVVFTSVSSRTLRSATSGT